MRARLQAPVHKFDHQKKNGAIDGARTRDNLDHNQGLYQLSYDRHRGRKSSLFV